MLQKHCSPLEIIIPYDWNVYFEKRAVAMYLCLLVFQTVLSIVPVGKKVTVPTKYGNLEFICNGKTVLFVYHVLYIEQYIFLKVVC